MANKTIKDLTIEQRVDQLKSNLGGIHKEVLATTNKMVDISLTSGAKWQSLMAKVLNKGTDLLEKQQDITLNTLEAAKEQYISGNERLVQLLGLDLSKIRKAATLRKETNNKEQEASQKDDLKVLQGIGPKVESLLNNAGIHTFKELANTSIKSLQDILKNAGSRYQSIDPSNWIKLAQEAISLGNKK